MNKEEHLLISGLGVLISDVVKQNREKGFVDLRQSFVSGIFGAIGGILPDQIEPATNPNHRGFFHSGTMLSLIFIGENQLRQNEQINPQFKKILSDVSCGYKLHLVVDATTPKSLPLI